MSVNPGDILSETEKSKIVLSTFQCCVHDRIWEKCVLLLIYSDDAVRNIIGWDSREEAARNFKANVRKHALAFGAILNQISSSKIEVCTVFEYKDQNTYTNEGFPGIVVVPVRSQVDATGEDGHFVRDPDIIPGIPATYSWRDVAWCEISNKIAPLQGQLKKKNFNTIVNTVSTTLTDVPLWLGGGAVAGGTLGAIGGPIGASIGVVVGGAAGFVAGVAVGLTTSFGPSLLEWMMANPDEKIKRLRQKVPH